MHDAVAGRVAVYFLSNLPLIDHAIRSSDLLEVSTAEPPVAYLPQHLFTRLGLKGVEQREKESGYSSIHYILRFKDGFVDVPERPWWELQVRTVAEHVWAELHHILGYKPEKRTYFAVRKQFQIVSGQLHAIDEHFNLLYEELSRFQVEGSYDDDDPLNAENIAAVLSELGIGCAQNQVDGLLRLLHSRKVDSVLRLREVGIPANIERIRNAYRQHAGRDANDFEVVACLAAIVGAGTDAERVEAIHLQLDYLNSWEELKRAMREGEERARGSGGT